MPLPYIYIPSMPCHAGTAAAAVRSKNRIYPANRKSTRGLLTNVPAPTTQDTTCITYNNHHDAGKASSAPVVRDPCCQHKAAAKRLIGAKGQNVAVSSNL